MVYFNNSSFLKFHNEIQQFKVYFSHSGINIHQFKVMSRGPETAAAIDEWRRDGYELRTLG
jgi:hypothetical protein